MREKSKCRDKKDLFFTMLLLKSRHFRPLILRKTDDENRSSDRKVLKYVFNKNHKGVIQHVETDF